MLIARNLSVSAALPERTVNVIENLDFWLAPGRILGLVGELGAGKSMIGRTVAQLLPPLFSRVAGRNAVRWSEPGDDARGRAA